MAATEMIINLPGLFDADLAAVSHDSGFTAIAVNKAIVLTDAKDVSEWIDKDYVVSDEDGKDVDEVLEMDVVEWTSSKASVRVFQKVAQMVLVAGEPGPRAIRFLERVVADDKFADRTLAKGKDASVTVAVAA